MNDCLKINDCLEINTNNELAPSSESHFSRHQVHTVSTAALQQFLALMTSQHNDVTMTSHCSAAPPTVGGGVVGGLLLTVGVADRAGFDGSELLL